MLLYNHLTLCLLHFLFSKYLLKKIILNHWSVLLVVYDLDPKNMCKQVRNIYHLFAVGIAN